MLKIYVLIVLLAGGVKLSFAQNSITLSDSIVTNSQKLPVVFVKSGGFNVFPKLTFGEYKVVSGKLGSPQGYDSSNLFGTKSKSRSSRKFSFVLADTSGHTVKVTGVLKTVSEIITPLQVSKSFSVGSNQQTETLDLSANIAVAGDTSHVWTLSMKTESEGEIVKYEGFLTDGKRTILITPLRTTRYELPAYGYEFTENDRFYSAYQMTGRLPSYQYMYKIYLAKQLDPTAKMALSGAMIALLELKDVPN